MKMCARTFCGTRMIFMLFLLKTNSSSLPSKLSHSHSLSLTHSLSLSCHILIFLSQRRIGGVHLFPSTRAQAVSSVHHSSPFPLLFFLFCIIRFSINFALPCACLPLSSRFLVYVDAMVLLGKYGVRRLPVIDSHTGDITNMITQRQGG